MLSKRLIVNSSLFIIGWLICLTFNNTVVLISTLIILLIHFRLIGHWKKEKEIVFITLLPRSTIDSFLGNLNILHFTEESRLLPLRMACFWALLGTALRHSMSTFKKRLWLAWLAGLALAPINYFVASLNPDNALLEPDEQSLIILPVVWSMLLPLLFGFSSAWKKRYKKTIFS